MQAIGRWALLSAVFLSGCSLIPRRYAPAEPVPDRYYVASFAVERETDQAGLADRAEALAPDAAKIVRPGRRVAFFPPDSCLTTSAAPEGASDQGYIEMKCGVLMSNLETHMARAGYQVISWQALKPTMSGMGMTQAGSSALERARGLGIDVLFEIDQLSASSRVLGQVRATGIEVYQQTEANDREPLAVDRETGLRCKSLSDQAVGLSNQPEPSATLSAKAVDVASGRAIWYYRKNLAKRVEQADRTFTRDFYFRSAARLPSLGEPVPRYNGAQRWGRGLTTVGWITMLAGGIPFVVAVAEEDDEPIPAGLAILGTGLHVTIAGGVLKAVGNARNREPIPYDGPLNVTYPPPEDVLCSGAPSRPPWVRTPTTLAAPLPTDSSSFSFEDRTSSSSDENRRVVEELFDATVQDFVRELVALSNR